MRKGDRQDDEAGFGNNSQAEYFAEIEQPSAQHRRYIEMCSMSLQALPLVIALVGMQFQLGFSTNIVIFKISIISPSFHF
ncbi:hypothetical protein AJ87_40500 [Rhizobium yanglingense]|nr:hypothetical protein AJ87_40500 [Rhizobium yanglingense]